MRTLQEKEGKLENRYPGELSAIKYFKGKIIKCT